MKFHLLPIGTHFDWKGEAYAKHSPIAAQRISDGKQVIVPRSAEVGTSAASQTTGPEPADSRGLIDAVIRDYCHRCDQGMQRIADLLPPEVLAPLLAELEQARTALFEALAKEQA
ncbi:MAG: hypothetical protein KJ558_15860 [Gammaproteobacteria bacterium]|nr:hypothetical protein [Gammaproteobacteria bacterium]MBU1656264.1 hypothetical protein [Gammaproteobacteria bacterium]MBU1959829.1 hypothetical protein [Gammaproteobacteria bacterium]